MPCTHLCHCPSHDGIIICTYVCGPLENRDYLQFIPLPSTPPLPPVWSRGPSILKVLGFLNQLFDEQWTRVVVGEDQGGVFLSRPADKPQPHRPLYFLHSGTQLGWMNLPPLCWDLEPTSKSKEFWCWRRGARGPTTRTATAGILTTHLLLCRALGMGGTRGRIYIKHPHLFKVGECWESGRPVQWSRWHWELSVAQRSLE